MLGAHRDFAPVGRGRGRPMRRPAFLWISTAADAAVLRPHPDETGRVTELGAAVLVVVCWLAVVAVVLVLLTNRR